MSYEFKKLSEVETVEKFPEGASVLIESEGEIKRCPSNGLGGGNVVLDLNTIGRLELVEESFQDTDDSGMQIYDIAFLVITDEECKTLDDIAFSGGNIKIVEHVYTGDETIQYNGIIPAFIAASITDTTNSKRYFALEIQNEVQFMRNDQWYWIRNLIIANEETIDFMMSTM